ncbi:MAG: hypothetical protein ABS910_00455 [Arthrobacter sp.]
MNQPARLLVTIMDPVYYHGSGFIPGATQLPYSILRWATAAHIQSLGAQRNRMG